MSEDLGSYVMPVGKWKGCTFESIYHAQASYLHFVANLSPDPDSGHADLWFEARDAAKAYLKWLDAPTGGSPRTSPAKEYERDRQRSIVCTSCQQLRDFSDVLMLTEAVLAIKCSCQAAPIRSNRNHPRFAAIQEMLLRGWEGVAIPYVAAEYSPLACPAVDHKWNRFALLMATVDDAETFLDRCKRDDARSLPMSSDGSDE